MSGFNGWIVCAALAVLAACGGGSDDREAQSQGDRVKCADVVADPVFEGQAEVVVEFESPGRPISCTLQLEADSPALAALGVADVCSDLPVIAVSIEDAGWVVDLAQTEQLTAENC